MDGGCRHGGAGLLAPPAAEGEPLRISLRLPPSARVRKSCEPGRRCVLLGSVCLETDRFHGFQRGSSGGTPGFHSWLLGFKFSFGYLRLMLKQFFSDFPWVSQAVTEALAGPSRRPFLETRAAAGGGSRRKDGNE